MASNVSGKIAFVTGGASGIGAALAAKLVDGGAEVWIADRQIVPAQELARGDVGGPVLGAGASPLGHHRLPVDRPPLGTNWTGRD
jgi:NAD(P)-dependent dehydrogenase (short-subunit alcohol dehydrogenase family)